MKSKALKCLVLASTLALFNCGDAENTLNDIAAAQQQGETTNPELGQEGQDGQGVVGGQEGQGDIGGQEGQGVVGGQEGQGGIGGQDMIGSSSAVVPESSGDILNQSSSAVVPESSGDINPASSTSVGPQSSVTVDPRSSSQVMPKSSSSEAVASSSSEEVKPAGIFLAEGKEEEKDQMQIVYTEDIEPCIWDNDKKRNLCKILAYPKQLSETQKHAVVVWGPGGGSDPKDYRAIISRLASHGFVVVALRESPGNANEGIEALNWLDKKNKDPNDPLYNKLDMNTVGASGHSMGGLESEQMVIKDKRVLTAFLNNSGDWNGAGANKVATDRSIAILYGEGGMERGNAENDYNNAGVKAPACLIQMTGGRGNECYEVSPGRKECGYGHGSGSWDGMAATVAWMRWHLGGEDFRKADFVGSTGKYIDGNIIGKQGKWKGQCKNF